MAQIILDSNNNLIQGDFDNATLNNRTKLQTTTTNATTNVYVVPNGSSTSAGVSVANNSNLTNASKIVMATNGTTDTQIISGVNGSGTYLPLSFYTNNAFAMTIDTSQNVGIGTTSPAVKLDVYGAIRTTYSGDTSYYGTFNNATGAVQVYANGDSAPLLFGTTSAGGTTATERMRIDSSGNAFIGCTATVNYTVRLSLSQNSGTTTWSVGPSLSSPANFYIAATNSTGVYLNGTAATSWTSASDETLKENLVPIENGLEKVQSLRAVIGNFIEDEEKTKKPFLIAQDVEKVLPEAVSINKLENGSEYLGLSYTDTIPLLVAAIKELKAIVDAQQQEINELKAK